MENLSKKGYNDIVSTIIDAINDGRLTGKQGHKIHQECFNTDYFIIGYFQAEEWLKDNYGIFKAIEKISDYEQENFGEISTKLSSAETVVNMLAYILGEELINTLDTVQKYWDSELTEKKLSKIKEELESIL